MNLANLLIFSASFINIFLGYLIYTQGKRSPGNLWLSLFTVSISGWGLSIAMMTIEERVIWPRLAFWFISLAFTLMTLFLKSYLNDLLRTKLYFIFIFLGILFSSLSLSSLIVKSVTTTFSNGYFIGTSLTLGTGYNFLLTYYIVNFAFIVYLMVHGYRRGSSVQKFQMATFFLGSASFAFLGLITNLILPRFNIFNYNNLGPVFSLVMIASFAYSIINRQFLNIKSIATEFFVFTLWVFLLTRVFLVQTTQELVIDLVILLTTVLVGILLVRSVSNEIRQREKIEKLASDLTAANTKLQGLDQLKSEFVSLASHQLRGPLTAIKGYTSEIIEGDFGEVPKHLFQPLHTILKSCQSLVTIVEDFLNVSRMEQGKMTYDRTFFDMADLIEEVVRENQPNFDRKKLKVYVMASQGSNVEADRGKIKQIVGNLIDNSIKYTPAGEVHVGVARNADKIVFSVKDTGVGIRRETMPKLFQKFSRAEDASKANILGTGLGLYIASQMIKAHGGRIWAESAGEGKGSAFFVELLAA